MKYQIINTKTKARFKDAFYYLGYYPQCDFMQHVVYDNDWSSIPDMDLPLLLWHAGEFQREDTSLLNRDYIYVTGNNSNLQDKYFNIHDIAASKIWPNKLSLDHTKKKKKFLFLNAKDVGHRRYVYTHLYLKKILQDCIYSYRQVEDMDWWFDFRLEFNEQDIEYSKLAIHTLPYKPFKDTNTIRDLPQKIYNDTYCSIVGETCFQHYPGQQVPLMLTEKTYSACANLHMFVVVGPYGSLKLLQKQGFETFSDIWDETYDTEDSPKRRLMAICDTIDYINKQDMHKLYKHCKERLLHNQNLIYSIDVKNRVDKVTTWLLESKNEI